MTTIIRRTENDGEELHQVCRKCQGVGGAHSLRCSTLSLPAGVPLYEPAYPEPGSRIPAELNGGQDGYVVGRCGHPMYRSDWAAGYRRCERCAR